MKYKVTSDFISRNRSGKKLVPVGMVLHSTASPGATDEAEQDYFDRADRKASAHVFIDWDSITITVPLNEQAWHAGPTANKQFIGVEMCEPKGKDTVKFNEVYDRTVWYFAYLMSKLLKIKKITKDNLMSHNEVSIRWKESTHVDPTAYLKLYGKNMDQFRKDVQAVINKGIF